MKRLVFSLLALLSLIAVAQTAAPTAQQREKWLNEINQYRCSYFTKELQLSDRQQKEFFPLYEEMEAQTRKIDEETRVMEQRLSKEDNVTDLEYETATEAIYDSRVKTAEIERSYLEKFQDVLTHKQLFQLLNTERKFQRDMMRQHHRLRSGKK